MGILFIKVSVWHLLSPAMKADYLRRYEVRLTDDRGKPYAYEVG